ncbi:hypothetical protein NDI85_08690 [Halomicroarcula sp. S1AR25-4]|uniref:DUF7527 domain-containing protein n=1 Tax=Haloarcula sp. S1AR25-4 TaxID=2950538 RepID=UPI0028760AF7|nr:hypothetical protein [Halomicroarcula sp. S1AR25-4]MDS0277871.1 hypothetical protein [Halomicroarcula sp. S1AR25-4]
MSTQTVELVSEWDSVPFDGGYEGLRTLADQEFSGAVVAGPTRLFMLNGTVIGIIDGDIEAFETDSGTAREAPHDALPLLAVMQERNDEVRAKYYTQETSIADVDRTLSDGNFTGFVELSENVLSGDYYLVYHQGRSMSVAWVGSAERLITDDEAFEQADDEVGIYEVKPAEISPVEIPEPSTAADAADVTDGQAPSDGTAIDDASSADPSSTDEGPVSEPTGETQPPDSTSDNDVAEPAGETQPPDSTSDSDVAEPDTGESTADRRSGPAAGGPPGSKAAGANQGAAANRTTDPETTDAGTATEQSRQRQSQGRDDVAEQASAEPQSAEPDAQTTEASTTESPNPSSATRQRTRDSEPTQQTDPAQREQRSPAEPQSRPDASSSQRPSADSGGESAAAATTADLETRAIPSLDPDRSTNSPNTSAASDDAATQPTGDQHTEDRSSRTTTEQAPTQTTQTPTSPAPERVADLEAELDGKEAEIARLESEIDDLETTNEELRAERDRLQSELEAARTEIERLEDGLAEAQSEDTPSAGTRLSGAEAIDGTNLFVRYHSKGEATLAQAHDGDANPTQVEENLRLEYHTQFDATDAAVEGTEFETFLQDSIHYRFVEWLIRNLLYEIRDTGHAGAMQVLYDALPEIDRAELNGKVTVTYTEDGQEHRSQEQFDVVVRDRMGNPLLVANINDSRQPATEGQMTDIVRNAERVGNASDSLAAAFLVTSSFFEPEALETAEEATSSGLFSRDKRKSFVNLSRKDGYHLCLLEARNQEFHLAVPEL